MADVQRMKGREQRWAEDSEIGVELLLLLLL